MSSAWPSAYGYKYTPIGLRQREKKEDTGKRFFYTSVHLPEGGYLLDIERTYNPDGSVGKKETANNAPGALPSLPALTAPPSAFPAIRGASPFINDPLAIMPSSSMSDLERQADDIIANFRARRGVPMEASDINLLKYHDDYQKDMAQRFAIDRVSSEMKPRAVDVLEPRYPNLPKIPKTSDLNTSFSKTSSNDCNAVDYNTRTPDSFELKPQIGAVKDHYNNILSYNITPLRDVLSLSFSHLHPTSL